MFEPNSVYAKIAYDAVLLYVKTNTKLEKRENEIPQALKLKLGCYVSIYDNEDNLRGRFGSPEPKQNYLFHEIIENAILAAKDDSDSTPLSEKELNKITVNVDVLSKPKAIENIEYLKPHKHGLIIETTEGDKTLIFPELDGISTPKEMIEAAKEKAGVKTGDEDFYILHFTTTTYK